MALGSLFKRPPPPMLGIDISASSIKLVELNQDKGGAWVLERCAMEPLEKGWVADGNIEKFDEVADALRRVVKKSGSKAKHVALALPHTTVIAKRIFLPAGLSEQEMELHVESEASQYIPFALDEVSLDFCVAGESKNADEVEVLLAASRKDKVEDRQGLAESAGLQAAVLDIEMYAARLAAARLIEQLPTSGKDALGALVKVGGASTSLQVVRNDELLFERDQSFGGVQLTQMLARHYGFSQDEAEHKKRTGDLPNDYGTAVLAPFVDSLAQEVARSLQFFYTSTPYQSVHQVLVFGGSAGLPGLEHAITAHAKVPAAIANPFQDMRIANSVRKTRLDQEAPSYLTACGLAMRRFYQ